MEEGGIDSAENGGSSLAIPKVEKNKQLAPGGWASLPGCVNVLAGSRS
ncbi:hypothetical protein ACFCYB_27270 [Streptomyces sp. NPDC056309]